MVMNVAPRSWLREHLSWSSSGQDLGARVIDDGRCGGGELALEPQEASRVTGFHQLVDR